MVAAEALDDIAPQASAAMAARSEAEPRWRPIDWNRLFQTARNEKIPATDAGDVVEFIGVNDWLLVGESEADLAGFVFIFVLHERLGRRMKRKRELRISPIVCERYQAKTDAPPSEISGLKIFRRVTRYMDLR
jgi:hypothetical protein